MNLQPCLISRKSEIVIQELGGEILIYDLKKNKAYSLNHTSALVWQMCDGTNTVADIASKMTDRLDSVITEDFVWLALEQLKTDNLLENSGELNIPFEGLSRRDAIRRAGLATLVALPVIATLVAPPAANAQSGCGTTARPNGCNCGGNGDCASSCCGAVSAGAANQFCVAPGSDGTGSYCRVGCECSTNCCVGNSCASVNGVGSGCTTACQCSGGCCVNGTCSLDTVPSGGACSLACQCIGSSNCVGGFCT